MKRQTTRLLLGCLLLLAGCGKRPSFVDAQAIYQEEKQKLEQIKKEWDDEWAALATTEIVERINRPIIARWRKEHPDAGPYAILEDENLERESQAAVDAALKPARDAVDERFRPLYEAQKKVTDDAFALKESLKH